MVFNKRAVGTSSLGLHSSHTLDIKIKEAAKHNFNGIEIVYGDLEAFSQAQNVDILTAARQIRTLCSTLNLHILSLCPFENYEGNRSPLSERLQKAQHWMTVARALGASYMQVPAQFDTAASGDMHTIVSELQQLTDLGTASSPTVEIAYEPMSWSTHHATWQSVVHLAELVDRPTFKICLDTFHIATKLWASPFTADGLFPNAHKVLADDLQAFTTSFPGEKLAYLQLSDAARFETPFSKEHPWATEGEPVEFSWSRHGRPFPGEREFGGYLPVSEILQPWMQKMGNGWVSLESFDWRMRNGKVTVEECAGRAEKVWGRLEREMGGAKSRL